MTKRIVSFLLPLLLSACAAGDNASNPTLSPIAHLTGGITQNQTTALYWLDTQQNAPLKLFEQVNTLQNGHYQSEYQWQNGVLRQMSRTGVQSYEEHMVPFSLTVRFDSKGNAIYQRYLVNEVTLPLAEPELAQISRYANEAVSVVKKQRKEGERLIQGHWQGQSFISCQTGTALPFHYQGNSKVQFTAPKQGYMALLGSQSKQGVKAKQILWSASMNQDCVTPQNMISKS
ncbi:DUF1481 domain-containing protein [Photobacterium damselae]|nr:DUF1481 domain-containing protein [Photobacterium damselae]